MVAYSSAVFGVDLKGVVLQALSIHLDVRFHNREKLLKDGCNVDVSLSRKRMLACSC